MAFSIVMVIVIIQKLRCQILLGVQSFRHLASEAKMVMPSQGEVILKKAALLILHLGLLLGLLPRRVLMFLVPVHFNGSQEMKQELDGTVASRKCSAPISAPLDASNVRADLFSEGNMHVKGGNTQPEECISGQGPWHAVIAYDAWVLLCLHSWARDLMEAPTFLENECALLRSAFSLQHILLQSEEELFEKSRPTMYMSQLLPNLRKQLAK